ncbi:hypothetical protein MCA0500 [Methylococcus capsulatus str. Bath]|uniref:Uncharacterized protein n=1 Tax=Methylococcus capsulatus (strain ATCC 33009 / NCIMB 11132 / Bath) TaxID=243233 RepID=Q60BH5_METCA|nr:hypothetical protein MCA0500 [Methylococcus capsulatus str. Bath]
MIDRPRSRPGFERLPRLKAVSSPQRLSFPDRHRRLYVSLTQRQLPLRRSEIRSQR